MTAAKRGIALAIVAALLVGCGGHAPSAPATTPVDAVRISADRLAFEPRVVEAPASRAFVIAFENREAAPHNVHIHDASGASVMNGEVFGGFATRIHPVPALAPGTYTFVCDVHPGMDGQLLVVETE